MCYGSEVPEIDPSSIRVFQHGGDINATDHTGQTALHWSAVRGAIQVAELLLQEGARVDATDMYGYQVHLLFNYFIF